MDMNASGDICQVTPHHRHSPAPQLAEAHQIFYVIVVIQAIIVFLCHGQVRLISPQEQVLPPHRVSQVKDQVLMGEGIS